MVVKEKGQACKEGQGATAEKFTSNHRDGEESRVQLTNHFSLCHFSPYHISSYDISLYRFSQCILPNFFELQLLSFKISPEVRTPLFKFVSISTSIIVDTLVTRIDKTANVLFIFTMMKSERYNYEIILPDYSTNYWETRFS